MKIKFKKIKLPLTILLTLILGSVGGYFANEKFHFLSSKVETAPEKQENKYVAFLSEVYDKIQKNYWQEIEDKELNTLYAKGIEKLTSQPQNLKCDQKKCLITKLEDLFNQIDDENRKKEFSTQLADIVLANLQPFGRSRLYVKKDEQALSDRVKNKTDTNFYEQLGVEKQASQNEIAQAIETKKKELSQQDTQEAQQKLEVVEQAEKILGDKQVRKNYDTQSIVPTIDHELITPQILHIHITKFSPTTLEDLQRVTKKYDQGKELDTLILDLRDNVGGAIDGLTYFLGPFIGNNQYAYQFFHQGETTDYKTKIGWLPSLVRYKKVVVLINENAQSSAEVMASVLKKYNVGVLVGTPTKGWGTVEKVFDIDNQIAENEKYSMFLVHSVTLRADGQPIQGRGVEPYININDSNWQNQLYDYLPSQEIVSAVKEIWGN